jgi:hypothetical protein
VGASPLTVTSTPSPVGSVDGRPVLRVLGLRLISPPTCRQAAGLALGSKSVTTILRTIELTEGLFLAAPSADPILPRIRHGQSIARSPDRVVSCAVRVPPAADIRGADQVPDPPQQPRIQRQRRRDATVAEPDREAAQGPGGRGWQVMEHTATAILAGLGTMLVVAAVMAGLVWLAYRLADRS